MKPFKYHISSLLLILGIAMVLIGTITSFLIQNSFGRVNTTEIIMNTNDNVKISGTLQVPRSASISNPAPGIVLIHGVFQSKEWIQNLGIELSRRGFVTLTIDASAHGNSEYTKNNEDRGGAAALEYLNGLDFVNGLGMIGHSMGTGIIMQTLELSTIEPEAIVFIGGGWGLINWANVSYPNNLLIAVGKYDELIDISSLKTSLYSIFGSISSINSGEIYGNFTEGSARQLIIGESNHLFEIVDPVIMKATIEWLKNSFTDSLSLEEWISSSLFIYPLYILGGVISVIGILITIIPISIILIEMNYFKEFKISSYSHYFVSSKEYWAYGALYAILGLISILPALFLGVIIPFPQNMGSALVIWLLAIVLITFPVIRFIFKAKRNHKDPNLSWSDFGIEFNKLNIRIIGKSFFLSFLIFFWLYFWTLILDMIFILDFRAFFPIFNDLPILPPRLLIAPIYILFAFPFFLVEGIWLFGLLRTDYKKKRLNGLISWIKSAFVIKCGIFVVIISFQIALSLLTGSAFISGSLGFNLLFFWFFLPVFTITTLIGVWTYFLTKRVYLGAALNSILFSWIFASFLPMMI